MGRVILIILIATVSIGIAMAAVKSNRITLKVDGQKMYASEKAKKYSKIKNDRRWYA